MTESCDSMAATSSSPEPDSTAAGLEEAAAITQPDGHQFSLAIKPKGTPLFKVSALYKSRLRFCIFLHILLFLVMLCRLSEDILDRMDVFILELEELYIPKPLPWEWLWTASIIFAFIGLSALSNNSLPKLHSYAAGILVLSICPLFGAAIYYYSDVSEYAEAKSDSNVEFWKGYPVAVYVYGFLLVAFQVHIFSVYFAAKLIKMWRVKMKRF